MNARDRIKALQNQYRSASADWFRLQDDGESAEVRFLVSDDDDLLNLIMPIHEVQMGPKKVKIRCTETADCPLCNQGNKPRLMVFLYLVDYRDGKIKVWERPNGFIGQVLTLIDEYGPLNNRRYKIVRNGKKGDTKTSYVMMAKDKDDAGVADLPERPDPYASLVKKFDVEGMKAFLAGGGGEGMDAPPVQGEEAPKRNGAKIRF